MLLISEAEGAGVLTSWIPKVHAECTLQSPPIHDDVPTLVTTERCVTNGDMMRTKEELRLLVQAAIGEIKTDLIVTGGKLLKC